MVANLKVSDINQLTYIAQNEYYKDATATITDSKAKPDGNGI
jgi:hypothetical protein